MINLNNKKVFLSCLGVGLQLVINSQALADEQAVILTEDPPKSDVQSATLIQGLGGVMVFEGNTYKLFDSNGVEYVGDIPTMPMVGGAWQNSFLHGDFISLGGESGFLLGFMNDSVSMYSVGNSLVVQVKNKFYMLGGSFGINLDIHPSSKFRIYGGAGPLFSYGSLSMKNDEEEVSPAVQNETASAFTLGFYARAGAEIKVSKKTRFGVQVRYEDSELDFGHSVGVMEMRGTQYMVTFTEAY